MIPAVPDRLRALTPRSTDHVIQDASIAIINDGELKPSTTPTIAKVSHKNSAYTC